MSPVDCVVLSTCVAQYALNAVSQRCLTTLSYTCPQYMRLLGYPASSISVLTTYNGQKALLKDVFERRCAAHPAFGRPARVGAQL